MTNKSHTIDDIIDEIKGRSSDGDYIYRGENKHYQRISSALYREYANINVGLFNLKIAQDEMLSAAKKHIGEQPKYLFENFSEGLSADRTSILNSIEVEILTELQHYGGKTNLIDFTTDYLIAIFFACDGRFREDGRIILLEKAPVMNNMIMRPQNPRHRVIAQKSVFVTPPTGYLDIHDSYIVNVPADLKRLLLEYLRKYHGISAETIYNDIHGFIKKQNIHRSAYIEFHQGLARQFTGYREKDPVGREREFKRAIKHYDAAIELNPEIGEAYANRGECWLYLKGWRPAKKKF